MSSAMEQRHAAVLQELSSLGMEVARELHGRVMAAASQDEAERAARAFERVSRSVRQCLALEARLFRDARRLEREDRAEGHELTERRRLARKAQVKTAVERLIWTEAERPESLDGIFEFLLDEAAADPGFADADPKAEIARLAAMLGLPASPPPARAAEPADPTPWGVFPASNSS